MTFKSSIFSLFILFFQLFFSNSADAQINASEREGCLPLSVEFSCDLEGVKSYQWKFSNGKTSILPNPSITFEEAGQVDVSLIATLENNKVKSFSEVAFIQVDTIPVAGFEVTKNLLCKDAELQFMNKSVGAKSYLWSFGDGNQSTEENPYYAFTKGGKFTVTLKAVGSGGCEDVLVLENIVEVYEPVKAQISVNNNVQCLGGDDLKFNIEGDFSSVIWSFGDGNTSSSLNPEYSYDQLGIYNVLVTTFDTNGCVQNLQLEDAIQVVTSDMPEISVSEKNICMGQSVNLTAKVKNEGRFLWTLSDGREFEGKSIKIPFDNAGIFDISLHFTNEIGCQYTKNLSSFLEVKFIAPLVFDYAEKEGCSPFEYEIRNLTAGVKEFEWKVNGESISGDILNYTFEEAGEYVITAITKYENGCVIEKALEEKIIVYPRITELEVSEMQGCIPFTTNFTLSSAGVSKVAWYSGDGEISQGKNAEFIYSKPGAFYPKVEYTNEYGCRISHQLESPITVFDSTISFIETEIIQSCSNVEVQMNGLVGQYEWCWNFGDGGTSFEKNPVHVYINPGTYAVSLTTFNKNGCETTIANYNKVRVFDINPQATYTTNALDSCGNFEVNLKADLKKEEEAFWYLDRTMVASGAKTTIRLSTLNDITVVLEVKHGAICSRSKNILIKNPWSDCESGDVEE